MRKWAANCDMRWIDKGSQSTVTAGTARSTGSDKTWQVGGSIDPKNDGEASWDLLLRMKCAYAQ